MIVYGHHAYALAIRPFVREFRAQLEALPPAAPHDAIVSLFVDFGEACSAVVDACCGDRDDEPEMLVPWGETLQHLAAALTASSEHDTAGVARAMTGCRANAATLRALRLPAEIGARPAEGFAHYSLYPEQYAVAARRYVKELSPGSVVCIGIRTIGLPLAHVVAAAMRRMGVGVRVHTVRPRGHPFDRRLELSDRLRRRLRAGTATHYAIVDEGPGLSGSSFASVADALVNLHVAPDRISMFPSWNAPTESLNSARGRAAWQRHRRFVADFADVHDIGDHVDISAGAWRPIVLGDDTQKWPAVQPQHEKRKYLHAAAGRRWISKFAGLGRYGQAKLHRARRLSAAGFTSKPERLARGLLTSEWVNGTPSSRRSPGGGGVERVAAYIGFLRRNFASARVAAVNDLVDMMRVNVVESLGDDAMQGLEPLADAARGFAEPEVAVDGRMQPHEWIQTAGGFALKVDALDHHGDDFLPRCRDAAWDVAGAIVEFGLDRQHVERLVRHYQFVSGDATIAMRLPFYRAAYLAYRIGYATLASRTLGTSFDGRRFAQLTARYRRSLTALSHLHR